MILKEHPKEGETLPNGYTIKHIEINFVGPQRLPITKLLLIKDEQEKEVCGEKRLYGTKRVCMYTRRSKVVHSFDKDWDNKHYLIW
jgi:hypothetical protein